MVEVRNVQDVRNLERVFNAIEEIVEPLVTMTVFVARPQVCCHSVLNELFN